MERLTAVRKYAVEAVIQNGNIIDFISQLNKLVDRHGCTHISVEPDELYGDTWGVVAIKYELETDEEFENRISLMTDDEKRQHQKDLVEFARLKAKLYPEQ